MKIKTNRPYIYMNFFYYFQTLKVSKVNLQLLNFFFFSFDHRDDIFIITLPSIFVTEMYLDDISLSLSLYVHWTLQINGNSNGVRARFFSSLLSRKLSARLHRSDQSLPFNIVALSDRPNFLQMKPANGDSYKEAP